MGVGRRGVLCVHIWPWGFFLRRYANPVQHIGDVFVYTLPVSVSIHSARYI